MRIKNDNHRNAKTAQLAADAAVSAAEAKQYLLETQNGYQDVSASTEAAKNAAEQASLASLESSSHAMASSESALRAQEEASTATAAAENATNTLSSTIKQSITFTTGGTLNSTPNASVTEPICIIGQARIPKPYRLARLLRALVGLVSVHGPLTLMLYYVPIYCFRTELIILVEVIIHI